MVLRGSKTAPESMQSALAHRATERAEGAGSQAAHTHDPNQTDLQRVVLQLAAGSEYTHAHTWTDTRATARKRSGGTNRGEGGRGTAAASDCVS